MKIRAILELVRVEHSLMLILGVIVPILLLDLGFTAVQASLLFLCPFLISAGAFALNDYFDVESDRRNRKDRPIVRGDISKSGALWISVLLLALGMLAALPLGAYPLLIAVVFASLSVLYDWKLKDVALIGNMVIASSMAIVFIFTEMALAGTVSQLTMLICATSFLSGLGREVQKTVQDLEGDVKARGSRTLPVLIGVNASLAFSVLLIAAASIIALYMFLEVPPLKLNPYYLIPLAASVLGFAYASRMFYGDAVMRERGRKVSLYALLLGIFAYILGGI